MINKHSSRLHAQQSIDFEVAFSALPGFFLILQPDPPRFTIAGVSDELLQSTSLSRESLIGKSLFEAFPENPEAAHATGPHTLRASLEQALVTKKPQHLSLVRYDMPTRNGFQERYWVSYNKPVLNGQGDVVYIISSPTDETERFLAERERSFKKIDTTYHMLMQAPVAVCISTGPDHVIELANQHVLDIWGKGQEVIGKPYQKAIKGPTTAAFVSILNKVRRSGRPYTVTEFNRRQLVNGKEENKYFNLVCQPYFAQSSDRVPTGIFTIAHEVTDQVYARKKVEESQAQLQAIIEATPECIKIVAQDGTLLFMNNCGLETIQADESVINSASMYDLIAPEHRRAWIRNHLRVCNGESLSWEFDIVGLQGRRRRMATHGVTLANENGNAHLAVTYDVTERKRAEEDLKLKNEQLQRINNDLDNFIYTASHDLKTPISNIEGLLELLMQTLQHEIAPQSEAFVILDHMKTSTERFRRTITNLTDVVKLQQDTSQDATIVALPELVKEVLLDLEPMLKSADGQLEVFLEPFTTVRFSQKNLHSIVHNLLSNAIKYHSPDRPLRIELRYTCQLDYHVLLVKDNGTGISHHNQEQLFKMFKRFHDHVEGTGIGLYMIKKITENAGGRIEVDSAPGLGTTFKVYLPR